MKKMNRYITTVLLCIFCLAIVSCGKFKLLKDADIPSVDAGVNLKSQTIQQYLAVDHTKDLTSLSLFATAIQRAGLSTTLGASDDYTVVFLTDAAVNQLVSTIGYTDVNSVPPIILKNLLSDLIIKGRLKSTDLALNETRKVQTINGDYIYYTRTSTASDQYVLYINQNSALSTSAALIRTQDLEFANGIAQVTAQFTFYRLQDDKADDANPSGHLLTQNLPVSKDVYIRGGTGYLNSNFNDPTTIDIKAISSADATVGRIGVMQFPLTVPSFGTQIGSAKLYVYTYSTGLTSATTFSFSAYQGDNVDWSETAITWTNAPTYSAIPLSTVPVLGAYVGWISFDITSAVSQQYANGKPYINLYLKHNVDNFIHLRPREYQSGAYGAYITVTSTPQTILSLGNVNQLNVSATTQIATLTTDNLKMTGAADKNITYIVKQAPVNGYLVKYGIPLTANASFSQSDIAKGAIRYLYGGTGSTDKIIFTAKDNNGGYYLSDLSMNVLIK